MILKCSALSRGGQYRVQKYRGTFLVPVPVHSKYGGTDYRYRHTFLVPYRYRGTILSGYRVPVPQYF